MKTQKSLIPYLKQYLKKAINYEINIIAVYIFGSCLKEDGRRASDLDLAFLLERDVYKSGPLEAISPAYSIAARIGMKLNMDTDVTILNSSSLEIAYEIITSGKCIHETNLEARLEYEAAIKGMFIDFKPFILELRALSLDQL